MHQVISRRLRADLLAEELRLLYVAMTRAREGLALIATHNRWTMPKKLPADDHPERIPPAEEVHSLLQWLLPVFRWASRRRMPALRLQECSASQRASRPGAASAAPSSVELSADAKDADVAKSDPSVSFREAPAITTLAAHSASWQRLRQRLDWQYPYQWAVRCPGKTSPTQWRLWLEQDEETVDWSAWSFRRRAAEMPSFLVTTPSGLSAADRGRLIHRFLRHLRIDRSAPREEELRRQLAALVEQGLFTQAEAEAVEVASIAEFFRRPLGQRLCQAVREKRELSFSLMLPAAELPVLAACASEGLASVAAWAAEHVLVQGVMDLLFWEAGQSSPILVDFKSDDLAAEELAEAQRRYAPQLALYARAVSEALGQPCREVWLVFLKLRQDIRLEAETLARCLRP
ncbi:ATP-dependent helicase/nuclease subunit A [bacterium HR36]|nr:ATP-dependent helicase/nuclease subunit A [bacterium HR36]